MSDIQKCEVPEKYKEYRQHWLTDGVEFKVVSFFDGGWYYNGYLESPDHVAWCGWRYYAPVIPLSEPAS